MNKVLDFLIDTQTVWYWHDSGCPQHAAVRGNVDALRQLTAAFEVKPKLLVSVVTLGEIEFGHRVAPRARSSRTSSVRQIRERGTA